MSFRNFTKNVFSQTTRHAANLLVLVHAFPLNSRMYEPIVPLIDNDWRMLLVDLPGFGRSPAFTGRDVALMEDYAVLINELLMDETYSYLVIGGVSMGGYVTLAFERLFPEVSDAIILSNTNAVADADFGASRRKLVEEIKKKGKQPVIDKYFYRMFAEKTYKEKPELVAFLKELYEEASIEGIIQAQNGMGRRIDHSGLLEEIEKPVLLMTGQEDVVTPIEKLNYMAERTKNKMVKIFDSAGHLTCLEKPEEYAKTINEFLKKVRNI